MRDRSITRIGKNHIIVSKDGYLTKDTLVDLYEENSSQLDTKS